MENRFAFKAGGKTDIDNPAFTCQQSLRGLTPDPALLLAAAGIAATRRAEELSIAEFAALAEAFRLQATGPRATP